MWHARHSNQAQNEYLVWSYFECFRTINVLRGRFICTSYLLIIIFGSPQIARRVEIRSKRIYMFDKSPNWTINDFQLPFSLRKNKNHSQNKKNSDNWLNLEFLYIRTQLRAHNYSVSVRMRFVINPKPIIKKENHDKKHKLLLLSRFIWS